MPDPKPAGAQRFDVGMRVRVLTIPRRTGKIVDRCTEESFHSKQWFCVVVDGLDDPVTLCADELEPAPGAKGEGGDA